MAKKATAKPIERRPMVSWYNPRQLWSTAIEVLVSTYLGRHSDKRLLQALDDNGGLRQRFYYEVIDESVSDYWLDYVADVGDGFNSTHTVARALSEPTLSLKTKTDDKTEHFTEQGDLLIFGGDEVYPVARYDEYKARLKGPYNAAFPLLTPPQQKAQPNRKVPTAFAIPGNHDWYDSLVSFSDLFFLKRKFCGWNTIQNRSYFAIKLPRGWWLFATDVQLGSTLDKSQVNYFKQVMKLLPREDRIILCHAEPHWITAAMDPQNKEAYNENLNYFDGVLKQQVAVHIAGDRHYYRHHVMYQNYSRNIPDDDPSRIHKFVAGGGGAFLHPTHAEEVCRIGKAHKYKLECTYPNKKISRKLTRLNLLFPFRNILFALLLGLLYLLIIQAYYPGSLVFRWPNFAGSISAVVQTFLSQPSAFLGTLLLIGGLGAFVDTRSYWLKALGGLIHGAAHLLGMFSLSWLVALTVVGGTEVSSRTFLQIAFAGLILALGGSIVGSVIFGAYLYISLNFFNMHHNDAFASLKIEDYKNFLRMKINMDGDLTIYPIGIERVVKKWKEDLSGEHVKYDPVTKSKENDPFLIEKPVSYKKTFPRNASSSNAVGTPAAPNASVVEKSLPPLAVSQSASDHIDGEIDHDVE